MVTFLNNLPSFDKDNFSNFQPDLNQYAPKKQHSYVIGTTIVDRSRQHRSLSSSSSSPPSPGPSVTGAAWDTDEKVIINQRCNLIIQYLDKQCRDEDEDNDDNEQSDDGEHRDDVRRNSADTMFSLAAEKSRKRDIREVLDTNPESIGGAKEESSLSSSSSSTSKYSKKRRTSIQNTESATSSIAATSSADEIELIDVDTSTNLC